MQTIPNDAALVGLLKVNHHIEVYQAGAETFIKLIDDSGEGGFVDPQHTIREYGPAGNFLIPFNDGCSTIGTAKEVVTIVRHTPMTIERIDWDRSTTKVRKDYELSPALFPQKDEDFIDMLKTPSSASSLCGEPWNDMMRQAMEQAVEYDIFA